MKNDGKEQHNFEVVRGQAADFAKTANGAIDETKLRGIDARGAERAGGRDLRT